MDMTVVVTTSIICVTLIILNVIWIFKVRADKERIDAENKQKELIKALKCHAPIR